MDTMAYLYQFERSLGNVLRAYSTIDVNNNEFLLQYYHIVKTLCEPEAYPRFVFVSFNCLLVNSWGDSTTFIQTPLYTMLKDKCATHTIGEIATELRMLADKGDIVAQTVVGYAAIVNTAVSNCLHI